MFEFDTSDFQVEMLNRQLETEVWGWGGSYLEP